MQGERRDWWYETSSSNKCSASFRYRWSHLLVPPESPYSLCSTTPVNATRWGQKKSNRKSLRSRTQKAPCFQSGKSAMSGGLKLVGWSANPTEVASRLRFLLASGAEVFEHGHAQCRRHITLDPLACDGVRRADVVISRSAAISRSACQNGSSRLMLVLCPDSTTDRFRTGLGVILRNVALLRGQDRLPERYDRRSARRKRRRNRRRPSGQGGRRRRGGEEGPTCAQNTSIDVLQATSALPRPWVSRVPWPQRGQGLTRETHRVRPPTPGNGIPAGWCWPSRPKSFLRASVRLGGRLASKSLLTRSPRRHGRAGTGAHRAPGLARS